MSLNRCFTPESTANGKLSSSKLHPWYKFLKGKHAIKEFQKEWKVTEKALYELRQGKYHMNSRKSIISVENLIHCGTNTPSTCIFGYWKAFPHGVILLSYVVQWYSGRWYYLCYVDVGLHDGIVYWPSHPFE